MYCIGVVVNRILRPKIAQCSYMKVFVVSLPKGTWWAAICAYYLHSASLTAAVNFVCAQITRCYKLLNQTDAVVWFCCCCW